MQDKLITLRKKLALAITKHDYIKAAKIETQIKTLAGSKQHFTLDSITGTMSDKVKYDTILLMNRVFTIADILQGYALDLESAAMKIDNSVESVQICKKAKQAASTCLSITKEISAFSSPQHIECFQAMCDEIDMCTKNIINKYHQKTMNK